MRFFTLILLLTYANLSLALGFGDIELKSHLGEQLIAKVNVNDIEAPPEPGCFSVTDTSDIPAFRRANVALKLSNGNHQLTITTNEIISEPIINLRLTFHCDPSVNREYVLLMDPAPVVSIDKETSSLIDKSISSTSVSTSPETVPDKPAKKKTTKKKKVAITATTVDKKLTEAYTGKQIDIIATESKPASANKAVTNAAKAHTSADKPFLVISGGSPNLNENTTKPSLSLLMATEIDFARTETPTAPLAAADVMDEVTVMTNRLAHLEKQILSLQARNTQLLTEAEKAKNEGFSLTALQLKWLQNLLIALGIVIACAAWLRRKILRNRLDKEQESWFDTGASAATFDELTSASKNNTNNTEASIFDESTYSQSSNQSLSNNINHSSAFTEEEKNDNESILDNAEVFIAHGRPTLAIQLLQNYLMDYPTESPAIWLKLLHLLATEGPEAEYDAAVIECNQFFNIKMPNFADAAAKDKSTIEEYPHIVARLEGVWGSPFAVAFLNDLIYNQQSQPREGFERGTFEELFFLKQIAGILSPSNKPNQEHGFYQPDMIKPDLEKVALNKSIFADIEPLGNAIENDNNASIAVKSESNTVSSSYQPVPSYEVNMIFDNDDAPNSKTAPVAAELDLPKNNPVFESSESFQADEIDFPILADEIDIESAPEINMLDEGIVLESNITATQDTEQNIKPDPLVIKSKAKLRAKKQASSNVIEWDLPDHDKK